MSDLPADQAYQYKRALRSVWREDLSTPRQHHTETSKQAEMLRISGQADGIERAAALRGFAKSGSPSFCRALFSAFNPERVYKYFAFYNQIDWLRVASPERE